MKSKAKFGSLKLERMREKLQEYNFIIEYKKGSELINADAISRIHETNLNDDSDTFDKMKSKLISNDGKFYYKSKKGIFKEVPNPKDRNDIINEIHKKLGHKGRDAIYYELSKAYYWPKSKIDIMNCLKECQECTRNKQKPSGGEIFIKTKEPLEKVGVDILTVNNNEYILTFKDFYTRLLRCAYITSKESIRVKETLKGIIESIGIPKMMITDSGLEFNNKYLKQFMSKYKIIHHITSPDKSQSNGRVERLHRDLWQFLRKTKIEENADFDIKDKIVDFQEKYNNTYHRGIKQTPSEAWNNPDNKILIKMNTIDNEYTNEFKLGKRENFKEKESIYLEEDKNLTQNKINSKYNKEGEIYKKLNNDSYLIKVNDRIIKRNHAQIVAKKDHIISPGI